MTFVVVCGTRGRSAHTELRHLGSKWSLKPRYLAPLGRALPRLACYSLLIRQRRSAWYNLHMNVIVRDKDILGGTPVFRGTRVPVQTLFDYLEGGETLEDFLEGFPTVTREAALAILEEARGLLLACS